MDKNELIKNREELEEIAGALSEGLRSSDATISRYIRVNQDGVSFQNGKSSKVRYANTNVNKERINQGIYTETSIDDLSRDNIQEVGVARDLQEHRFNFSPKGIPLPTQEEAFFESFPTDYKSFDDELKEFSKSHPNTRMSRYFIVDQRVIVNSEGGKVIQSVPFLEISYSHGYDPIPTRRDLGAVCTSNDEVKKFASLIQFLADPTPDRRIKSAKSFSEAFHRLHELSPLRFGSLEEAGIPMAQLYDVVVLTGVPVHEIVGHHFEEPIRYLDFGETGTFKVGQRIENRNIVLSDNPHQRVGDFRALGFNHIDSYGRTKQRRVHIQDGEVKEFLGSEYADPEKLEKYMGLKKSSFVGNASQSPVGWFPQARMSCTVLDGQTEDFDIDGKLAIVSHEGDTDPLRKTYLVKAKECYVVMGGEPRRVIPLQVTGGINQALADMVLLDDWSYQTGMCEKPEPIYYPQSRGRDGVPVSQFARSQIWRKQQVYPLPISDSHLKILQREKSISA